MRRTYQKDDNYDSIDEDSEANTQKNLVLLGGTNDVEKIEHLQLRPHPSGSCITWKGSNVTSLCLSGSISLDLRDIGTSLSRLNELLISHCHLESLDGIANFPNLTGLYASFNNISDPSPCIYLEKISHIDLERNAIVDRKSLEPLSLCSELVSAVFRGNPFSLRNCSGVLTVIEDYEKIILSLIPQLKYVDRNYPSESSESTSIIKNEKLLSEHLEPPFGSEDYMMRCPTPVRAFSRNSLPLDDIDLLLEEHLSGSNTSFISDRLEMLSSSGKIYRGSPGRAFKSGFGSSSDISTRRETPVSDSVEGNI